MKFTKLVPCSSSLAILALLSPAADTWQSVQRLVSVVRTVCGKNVLNAWPLKPSAETVCCCSRSTERGWFCELDEHGAGRADGRDPVAGDGAVAPEEEQSSRRIWKL